MKTLAQAKPGGTFEIKDWSKLELLAGMVGEAVEPRDTLPKRVADAILAEFSRDHQSPSPLVEKLAPATRVAKWKELGIMPGGVFQESMYATSSCLTNVDGNYVSLALKGLRLGIATAYGAQIPLELAQALERQRHVVAVDIGEAARGGVHALLEHAAGHDAELLPLGDARRRGQLLDQRRRALVVAAELGEDRVGDALG